MNEYINLGQPFNDFVKNNDKLGRFNFRILPNRKSPSKSPPRKSPKQIGRFKIKHVRRSNQIKSPSNNRTSSRRPSPPKMTSLKRELSDPEYCMKKVIVRGFNFTIMEEPEKIEEKVKYLTEKIKENFLQTLEINKIVLSVPGHSDILLDEKNRLKNNIIKYNNQLNEIMDAIF